MIVGIWWWFFWVFYTKKWFNFKYVCIYDKIRCFQMFAEVAIGI